MSRGSGAQPASASELPPASDAGGAAGPAGAIGAAGTGGTGGEIGSRDGGTAGTAPMAGDDRGAEADFGAARSRFDRGDRDGARAALEAFVARHPEHPSRPAAEILLARLALSRGDPASARKILTGPEVTRAAAAGTAGSVPYYLGLA